MGWNNLPLEVRFWQKVECRGSGECWPWLGSRLARGYGHMSIGKGKVTTSSRVAFFLAYGHWPTNALHTCDNPPCCNPAHIYDGNSKDNMADCIRRGRWKGFPLRRYRLGNAKLTAEKLHMLLNVLSDAHLPLKPLAKTLDIGYDTIRDIVLGKTWQKEVAAIFCVG